MRAFSISFENARIPLFIGEEYEEKVEQIVERPIRHIP